MNNDVLKRYWGDISPPRTRLWYPSPIFFGIIGIIGLLAITMIIITPAFAETGNSCDFFCWLVNLFSFNFDFVGFDCAKHFDKMTRFYESEVEDKQTQRYTMQLIDYTTDLGRTFLDNRCAGAVNDWAYKSDFEEVIWHSGVDWNQAAQVEKLYHHDIDCPVNYDPICTAK